MELLSPSSALPTIVEETEEEAKVFSPIYVPQNQCQEEGCTQNFKVVIRVRPRSGKEMDAKDAESGPLLDSLPEQFDQVRWTEYAVRETYQEEDAVEWGPARPANKQHALC